jgi:peptidoglycan hydrolase-like protein with peptidoglycan-binding domain
MSDFHAGPVQVPLLERGEMTSLQEFLMEMGFNPGAIDGLWGPQIKAAWQAFANANNLPTETVDGNVWHSVAGGGDRSIFVEGENFDTPVYESTGGVQGGDGQLDAEEEAKLKAKYPNLAHLFDIPEIRDLLIASTQGDGMAASDFNLALENTEWFQTTNATQRQFDASIARDPASVQVRIDQQKLATRIMLDMYGLELDDEALTEMATDFLRNGTNEQQKLMIVSEMARQQLGDQSTGGIGGTAQGQLKAMVTQLQADARAYHLNYSEDQLEEWAIRIVEGRYSFESARATMRQQAALAYPELRDSLEQGITIEDFFAPTKNRLAGLLDMNPNAIDLTDERWSQVTQLVRDDGTVRPMTYSEIGMYARQQDEYWATEQGAEEGYGMMNGLLKTFGMI